MQRAYNFFPSHYAIRKRSALMWTAVIHCHKLFAKVEDCDLFARNRHRAAFTQRDVVRICHLVPFHVSMLSSDSICTN